jgi:hypothetical protein
MASQSRRDQLLVNFCNNAPDGENNLVKLIPRFYAPGSQ